MTMKTKRIVWSVWLASLMMLVAILWMNQPVASHDEPVTEVMVCQARDDLGDFTIPIGAQPDLLELCNEVGGSTAFIDDPGPDELIRIMWELGLYNPYILLVDEFFEGTELEDDEPPLE